VRVLLSPALRRASAEAVGTGMLVAVVVGSGIAAQHLSPGNTGLQLLENSLATGAGLAALILALGPISGAHFNPVVTLADRAFRRIDSRTTCWYVVAQIAGACVGCIIANLMFDLPAIDWSTHNRTGAGIGLGEVVATFGLLLTIIGIVRSGRTNVIAFAVGAYIAAAYWFTSSTSFANPAVTIGRMLTNTFAGISPSSVPVFVVCQFIGGALAIGLFLAWYPDLREPEMLMEHS
jgi:glycerol uptake facilitator-like aquaporin